MRHSKPAAGKQRSVPKVRLSVGARAIARHFGGKRALLFSRLCGGAAPPEFVAFHGYRGISAASAQTMREGAGNESAQYRTRTTLHRSRRGTGGRIRPARAHDEEESFPYENYAWLRETGYSILTIPEELGGLGANMLERLKAQERLAQGCGATALAINMHFNVLGLLVDLWRKFKAPQRRGKAAQNRE